MKRIAEKIGIDQKHFSIELKPFTKDMEESFKRYRHGGFNIKVGDKNQAITFIPGEDLPVEHPTTKYISTMYLCAIKDSGEWNYYLGPMKLPIS